MVRTFAYKAKKGPEEIIEDTIVAESEREAIEKITRLGLLPMSIKEIGAQQESVKTKNVLEPSVRGRVSSSELAVFSRELAVLLRAGVPILTALSIISEQTEKKHFKEVILAVKNKIKDGKSFSSSLDDCPQFFSYFYRAMIRAGEMTGTLEEALLRIEDYYKKQDALISKVRMALLYPIFVVLVGLASVAFIFVSVMPKVTRLFSSFGEKLPLATRILLALHDFLCHYWWWLIIFVALVILLFHKMFQRKTTQAQFHALLLRLPIIGPLVLKSELLRFADTLRLALKSGIPIISALNVSVPTVGNYVLRDELASCRGDLEAGGFLGKSLKSKKVFPVFFTNLISIGEESGSLEAVIGEISLAYERDVEDSLRVLVTFLEPVLILILGGIVGFIVMALLLPIFQINLLPI